MGDLDERDFSAIEAKIEEYNRTHDDTHSPNMYQPWVCYSDCAGCIRDEIKAETKAEIDALKEELAEVKGQLAEMYRLTSPFVVYK